MPCQRYYYKCKGRESLVIEIGESVNHHKFTFLLVLYLHLGEVLINCLVFL